MTPYDPDVEDAIRIADPYRGRGTAYLHPPSSAPAPSSSPSSSPSPSPSSSPRNNVDVENPTGAVVTPISLSTTFVQSTPGVPTAPRDPNSFGLGYEYSRTGNPTRGSFERAVSRSENATHCVSFGSGSAAASAVIHLLKPGEGVLCVDDVYGGTQRYFGRIVTPVMGIDVRFVDFTDLDSVREALDSRTEAGGGGGDVGPFKLLWLETPTNPTLKISDISACSALAHTRGALLCVDNTFCSPHLQNPLDLGADLVVHSVTKYIGGHSDVVMGVVCTNSDDLYAKLRFVQNGVGAVPSPFDCYLAHRGLKTLHLRMEAASKNAMAVALYLEGHDAVDRVVYPGLRSHPQHDLASRQQHGYGAVVTFYCRGGRDESRRVLENLRVFALAESLGAVESLAECPSLMTHASVPDGRRMELGIDDSLIRLSVGVEGCRDLIDDLDGALRAAMETAAD